MVTPTALLFDRAGVLRYRGPLNDDRQGRKKEPAQLLRVALVAVQEGRAVEAAEPRAFGSTLRLAKKR